MYDNDQQKALALIDTITNQLSADEPKNKRCERCNSVVEFDHNEICMTCWDKLTRIK